MKTLLFAGGSRAGNEFFLSLLDGHSQILQFPGTLRGNNDLHRILSHKKSEDIANNFIHQYKHFFDSRLSNDLGLTNLERHDELGVSKKKFYSVNIKKFKEIFIKISKKKNNLISNDYLFNNLVNLHKAYFLADKRNIKKIKLMVINSHLISYTKFFAKKILVKDKFDIVHTTRHPLSAISSSINNWINYKSGRVFFANSIFFQLNLIVNGIKNLGKINKNLFLIKLESMHLNNKKVMNEFCSFYKLRSEKCLKKSSFFKLLWWGDKISRKNLNGINKNFKIKYNKNIFYKKDFGFFNNVLKDFLLKYNYNIDNKPTDFFKNLAPLKCEIITWKNTIKHKKIKHIFSIPYFYFKRIIFINFFGGLNNCYPKVFGELRSKKKFDN